MDAIEKTLKSIEAPFALDVATGRGNFAGLLRNEYSGIGTIIGIDLSQKALAVSREAFEKIDDMFAVCMDSSNMALRDGSVDMVCISNSLHHMENLDHTFEEMMRALRPGGYFLVSEMYRDNQTEAQMTHVLMHEWWASIDTLRGVPHYRTFSRKDILRLCERLGLCELVTADYSSLDSDPLSREVIEQLDGATDAYIARLKDLGNTPELVSRGEELRERLHKIGFHSASTLVALGIKPV